MTQTRLAIAPVLVVVAALVLALLGNRFIIDGSVGTVVQVGVLVLWCAAPTFAGFSWRGFAASARNRYAIWCALAVGGAAAILIWQSVSAPAVDCSPSRRPLELVLPSIAIGGLIAGFFGLACWFATLEISAGRVGRGVIYGAVMQLLVVPTAGGMLTFLFFGLCQRPQG